MTAVSNTAFTAAQFNTYVRDNFLETAPAKASATGQIFVATGANAVAARTPSFATVATAQTTTSTSYGDLATVGPAVTVTTGTKAIIGVSSKLDNATAGNASFASYDITGATTVVADDTWATIMDGITAGGISRWGSMHMRSDLNPGSNTFTMRYKSSAATAAKFTDRHIVVIPL